MQGNQVEESVLAALDAVNARVDEFDVVVIIRGGGATSDLSALILICWLLPVHSFRCLS